MKPWAILFGVIALAIAAAALALRPPAPLPASAPPQAFSAARAMPDVYAIAQRPHPIRSAEQARVRDVLFGRMVDVGLHPQLRPVDSDRGTLFNLLGVLPGADRQTPAVLLMAHYDTVAAGPGAADDGAGVAALLEIARALKASGPHARDVMVLLTDGEEAGLYGAQGFFGDDPARGHIGAVINLEARGNRGRAVMFETHRQGGAMIGFLTHAGALTGANSLMPDLYRRLPNTTDLTQALAWGYAGVNFAIFGGLDAYHRPTDTPQRLDPASLQSIGSQALVSARALADAPTLPSRAADQVYADLLGGPILAYPPGAGWAILGVAVVFISAGAWRAMTVGAAGIGGIAAAFVVFTALPVLLALALVGDGLLRAAVAGRHLAPLLHHGGESLAGAVLLAGGLAGVWLWLAQKALRPESLGFGALKLVAVTAILLQIAAPLDAFMLTWPLLAAAVSRVLSGSLKIVAGLLIVAALAQVCYWTGLLYALVGQQTPAVLAPLVAVAALLLLPLGPRMDRRAGLGSAALAVIGVALTLTALRP